QFVARPSLRWTPSDDMEVILKYEYLRANADGASTSNRALHGTHSFDVAIDFPGFTELEVDFFTAEFNWEIGPGTLTNVMGYREVWNDGGSDIDGTTSVGFHIFA